MVPGTVKADSLPEAPELVIRGTGTTVTLNVDTRMLNGDEVSVKVSKGFDASQQILSANRRTSLKVTLTSHCDSLSGELVLRCGDMRSYVRLTGYGSPLPVKKMNIPKTLSVMPPSFDQSFSSGKNGYTLEFRLKSMKEGDEFRPWFVDSQGNGFQTVITDRLIALQSAHEKELENPVTSGRNGGGHFYNDDGHSHTYRIAVTSDQIAFIYRDGILLRCERTNDLAPRPFFSNGNGEVKENLLDNGDFEGLFDLSADRERVEGVEGWDIIVSDRWNSEQKVEKLELDNQLDVDNYVFWIRPYKWRDSWGDPVLEQVVDVVPGETYTLSALAKGGTSEKAKDALGRLCICEADDHSRLVETTIMSEEWQNYSLSYTAPEGCKQLAVQIINGKGKWGGDITPVYVDNVKLSGQSRTYTPRYGYFNDGATLDYFTIDTSGAYAPPLPVINIKF